MARLRGVEMARVRASRRGRFVVVVAAQWAKVYLTRRGCFERGLQRGTIRLRLGSNGSVLRREAVMVEKL
jgi:hypothetical protein